MPRTAICCRSSGCTIGDGLASAIYTQTTDVEVEVNGVMTYDRAVTKLAPETVAANRRVYDPPPSIRHVVAASDRTPQTWRYTTVQPPSNWSDSAFDDSKWMAGSSGFGAPDTRFARVGTEWKTSDIWLRRTIEIPAATLTSPHLRVFHDDDAQVYVNGTLVAELPGSQLRLRLRAVERRRARSAAVREEHARRSRASDSRWPVHRRRHRRRDGTATLTGAGERD